MIAMQSQRPLAFRLADVREHPSNDGERTVWLVDSGEHPRGNPYAPGCTFGEGCDCTDDQDQDEER